jgi:rubrerythrin|tara:strand:- start:420 stop:653 length:234 start_codon:yes stop_codon:yes gene_type:complete
MKDDEEAKKVYNKFFDDAMHLLNEHSVPVELVASTMIAIAQRLFKTHFSEKDYEALMDEILNHEEVKPYGTEKVRIH